MNNRYKFFKDRLRAIAARTDREFDIQEMLWNCEMARLWLENHWKHLGNSNKKLRNTGDPPKKYQEVSKTY